MKHLLAETAITAFAVAGGTIGLSFIGVGWLLTKAGVEARWFDRVTEKFAVPPRRSW